MYTELLLAAGGIGLFLLGMMLLTDGLRQMAGDALRAMLTRFTKTPATGAMVGAVTTAIVQSSSATTVTAVGFVAAGLLTFPQALGIIFGANIGTTITGWFIAVLGFQMKLGEIVLPLVLVGVLLRLFGRGKTRHAGLALTGFSLLFIGISAMQDGMAHFQGVVTPESFPDDTLFGRFQLVLIGIAITLVTQSSSAGVAAALVALHAGAISFPQAAAMVIGMDVGTTFTAALATIGGSAATRQTGYAHVLYNVLTGAMAFLLLGPFTTLVTPYLSEGSATNAQIALVGFHTLFNTLGVILVVPFAAPFGRLVTRLVRERGPRLTRRLDDRLLRDPASAIDAAVATIDDIAQAVITTLAELLAPDAEDRQARLATIGEALRTTQDFVQRVRTDVSAAGTHARHLAVIHTLDHLVRLSHRCTQRDRIDHLGSEPRLQRLTCILRRAVTRYLAEGSSENMEMRLDRLRAIFRDQRERYRTRTLDAAARQQIGTDTALRQLDSVRWLQRVSYHLWRIEHHQRLAMLAAPPPATATPAAIPIEED